MRVWKWGGVRTCSEVHEVCEEVLWTPPIGTHITVLYCCTVMIF